MKFIKALTLLFAYVAACTTLVHGYCIYNYSEDVSYWMRQLGQNAGAGETRRFLRQSLKPGENACCPYTTYDCNSTGDPNALLLMGIRGDASEHRNFRVNFPAGGWVELHGKGRYKPDIRVYNADGSSFPFEYVTTDSCFIGC